MHIPYGLRRFMHDDPKDNASAGADEGTGGSGGSNTDADDLLASIRTLLPKGGEGADADAINKALFRDNYRLREDRRNLRTQLASKTTKVPDGALLLEGDDAKAYQAFKGLGLSPEQISEVLVAHDDLSTRVTATDAATALGWKPKVLQDLISSKGLVIEDREVTDNGAKKQVPHVIEYDGDKEKATPLADYEPLKEYHPSLVATDGGTGGRTHQSGIRVPSQQSTGGRPSGEAAPSQVVQNQLSSRYRRPSDKDNKGKK